MKNKITITSFEFEFMMYATAKHYLEESLKDVDINTQPKIVIQALGVARRYLILHKDQMSQKRFMEINDSIDDKKIHEILDREISFLVFGMELIRLLRPIQLKQRKLDMFTANYTIGLIKMKRDYR